MKLNRTAARTVLILKHLSLCQTDHLEGISTTLEIPKTSTHDILSTLVAMNMVRVVQGQTKGYALAVGTYQFAMGYRRNFSYMKDFQVHMDKLAEELNRTCFFALPEGNTIVYMIKAEPPNPVLTQGAIGMTKPMYCTGLGKAYLAHVPLEQQEEIAHSYQYEAFTPYTLTSPQALLEELAVIRNRGYAEDNRELELYRHCVSAVVRNEEGDPFGAVSASGLYDADMDRDYLGKKISDLAHYLSTLCGHALEHQGTQHRF